MSKILNALIFFCSILYYAGIDSKSNKTNFVDGIDDLPLHHKMTVNKNSLVMFDTNQGNFVEVEIKGKSSIGNISKFYNEILPNLGWKSENNTKFVRGKDSLELQYSSKNQTVIVKFKLIQK